ncbi:Mpv17-like protein [Gryllus bimaculatus]|nr:Mpv17-like protein [Gryllus bimaculatus]
MGFTNTFKTKKMAHMKAIRWLQENPTIFESLQAGAVMGTGDLIAQKLIEKKETIDTKRLAAFTGFGLFIAGPVLSTWYRFLDKKLPFCWPRLKRSFVKMVADQTLMAPVYLAVLLSYFELTVGRGLDGFKEELERKYPSTLANNYLIWPAVMIVNFSFVPVNYQVLVTQTVAVLWNIYFAWKANQPVVKIE